MFTAKGSRRARPGIGARREVDDPENPPRSQGAGRRAQDRFILTSGRATGTGSAAQWRCLAPLPGPRCRGKGDRHAPKTPRASPPFRGRSRRKRPGRRAGSGRVARGATDFRKMRVSRTDVRDCIGEDKRTPPAGSIGHAGPRRPRGATGSDRIDNESNRIEGSDRGRVRRSTRGSRSGQGESGVSRGDKGSELWERSSRCACSHG
jgi:hypothetical protein